MEKGLAALHSLISAARGHARRRVFTRWVYSFQRSDPGQHTDIRLPTVIQGYDKFLTYIVDHNLQDVWEMKPIVNGKEIFEHLKMPKGPWMTKAVEMVVEWQLLHPECTDKEKALENLSARKGEL